MFGDKYVIPQKLIKYLQDILKTNKSLKIWLREGRSQE